DPDSDAVRIECMHIFAAEGPMAVAQGHSAGLPSLGIPLAGQTAQTVIARAAPQLAAAFGQKLAAQSAPVVGALAGAAINHAFASYYQNLARVHFGIIRLAEETGLPSEALAEALQQRIMRPEQIE
ncbi:MAG: EcsC family protein, partial [Paracoccus sp. (in: a-proteobacteria)]|nr:EcsC family protein [Paracoccus sp. (in: a-proteobacteria)]